MVYNVTHIHMEKSKLLKYPATKTFFEHSIFEFPLVTHFKKCHGA